MLTPLAGNKTKGTASVSKLTRYGLSLNQGKGRSCVQVNGRRHKMQARFIDLFCGIGGFRVAAEALGWKCVFSCDIDDEARKAYHANFGDVPQGDIRAIPSEAIPDHEVLFAGFPCQPFSIIGDRRGFSDIRGTLFFEITRILQVKNPPFFVLENVKQLVGHNKGRTFSRIIEVLLSLGYEVDHRVLNALDFGLPQKRERVFIIGNREGADFNWPNPIQSWTPLTSILEAEADKKHYASDRIASKRKSMHRSRFKPAIWHENKAGHISSYPYSCALRAGASYNYLLVDGVRRLTSREMLRLQGFPDSYKIVCDDSQTRKQAGNSVPVPVVKAVLRQLDDSIRARAGSNHSTITPRARELISI